MAKLASLGATATWPGRRLVRLGGVAGRRAQQAFSEPARWAVLSAVDAALAAADATLGSPLAREALARILDSELAEDVYQRLVAQPLDSPELDRVIARALDSPQAERLAGQVIDSRVVDVFIQRLVEVDGLWSLVDQIAQSPTVMAAISQQGVGFASQIAVVARDRSATADDRLERFAARFVRRRPRTAAPAAGEPDAAPEAGEPDAAPPADEPVARAAAAGDAPASGP